MKGGKEGINREEIDTRPTTSEGLLRIKTTIMETNYPIPKISIKYKQAFLRGGIKAQ